VPKQIIKLSSEPRLSIVSYNLEAGEEAFLSYTLQRAQGPPLRRTGEGPPDMQVVNQDPQSRTSHPFGLRLGTWLVRKDLHQSESDALEEAAKALSPNSPHRGVLKLAREEMATIRAHDEKFEERMPEYEIVGMQGCGDLTMNYWNVAYVSGSLAEDPNGSIVAIADEPLEKRHYSCLVKWKPNGSGRSRMSIEEASFNLQGDHRNNKVWIQTRGKSLPRSGSIEFAISNQQVIRDGEVVSAVATCHQFSDLRHLLQMPNINPTRGPLYEGEKQPYLPRTYFGKAQEADIWFGEKFLLAGKVNLLRAALKGPVVMPRSECDNDQLRGAMKAARYTEVMNTTAPLIEGQWRKTNIESDDMIEVFFRRNTYGWSMLGLTKDNRYLLSLACEADAGKTGMKLEDAAEIFRQHGAWNALLIDEGWDVFHRIGADEPVPLRRNRLRCVFIFAHRRNA
jgi:hypothetical protein